MIRPYFFKTFLVTVLTILSFNLKAQSYISDGVYIGGGSQFFNWTFDEGNYITDNGKGLSLKVGKSFSSEIGLYIGLDDAEIYNENSDSYEVTHFDIVDDHGHVLLLSLISVHLMLDLRWLIASHLGKQR